MGNTVISLRGFYNPDEDKSVSNSALRKRKKPRRRKAKWESVKRKVLAYLHLNDKATDIGICYCIHRETGWDMPATARECREYITKYYRKIRSKRRTYGPKKGADFYGTQRWKELRFVALRMSEGACGLCGARASDGVQLQVDHIKPRSRHPELQWDLENLQVLCSDCNIGKSNYDDTDYRRW